MKEEIGGDGGQPAMAGRRRRRPELREERWRKTLLIPCLEE
jgi:hypothetical protein